MDLNKNAIHKSWGIHMKTTKLPNYGGISSHDSEFNGLKKGLSLNPSAATKLPRQTRVVISEYKIS